MGWVQAEAGRPKAEAQRKAKVEHGLRSGKFCRLSVSQSQANGIKVGATGEQELLS